ncbi:DUF3536 domain-containing protein [Pontibacter sp. 172403-2]|uniref:DUF3536 domain-containing protein n=1 Tax=Pontibacter rufus TaxID=2791028 RepID=UPI0018AFDC76|nr:DUF3536 domain-containing protein [Pontibacter sp. 172403-2]MBF9254429.1 DUF3536 domain-containing protein [Pontibacter sp. 172403-2]
MNKYICVHGHFYQPPRENPWLNEVELQESALPYHDWNARITEECYARNSASRILNGNDNIVDIMNNYAWMSFNFGPTLLEWMQKKVPDTYQAILDADKESMTRFSGHGSALAQVYNHIIMPLANERDKQTQVIWGIYDFWKRFGRLPEGMWLAETAADTPTLEVLAEHGIKFTILSPYQARRFRKKGETAWQNAEGANIDPRRPYLCKLPSGREIALFFYDAPVSQGIAFEGLLNSGERLANRLTSTFDEKSEEPQLMHIATDGETYGHHHRFGEMALSYALHHIEAEQLARITIYAEYLALFPPQYEAQIIEATSWSCVHGVERWRSNCGCNTGGNTSWNQEWRGPLRNALDWLRDELSPLYVQEMQKLTNHDPWAIRNEYIQVIMDRSEKNVEKFIRNHTSGELTEDEKVRFLELLEMQYHTLLMYTSCGWFFDEVTGIETMQDVFYAARALQLAQAFSRQDLETKFVELLTLAKSNAKTPEDAGAAYIATVQPAIIDLLRVGAHYAISSMFSAHPKSFDLYSYRATTRHYNMLAIGRQKLAVGQAIIRSKITGQEIFITFGVLHLGDHQLFGGVREYMSEDAFQQLQADLTKAFERGNSSEAIMLLDKHFESHSYSFWHLFKDDQQKILDEVLAQTMQNIENGFQQVYDNNYPLMMAMKTLNMQLPQPLQQTVEFIVDTKLQRVFSAAVPDLAELSRLRAEAERMKLKLNTEKLNFAATQQLDHLMKRLRSRTNNLKLMQLLVDLITQLEDAQLEPDYWLAQNIAFQMKQNEYELIKQQKELGDAAAAEWCSKFDDLYNILNLKV